MSFKIDTNAHYTRILPENEGLSASMAGKIARECQERFEGEKAQFIVDFSGTADAETHETEAAFQTLAALHETCYNAGHSLVFTGAGPRLLAQLKAAGLHHTLNITPTLQEAIDMVNMEILERDLFNEEL